MNALSFTLVGADFGTDGAAPNDAFEMALRDESGHSVVGMAGLSHTDALLNIQSDGTAWAGSNVYMKSNLVGNGSRLSLGGPIRFAVDLSGVADGATLTLDFDLLGLGAANSRVRIDDVLLRASMNSEPVAADDAVTTAEDSTLTINVLANDTDAEGDALTTAIVTGPQHGTLTANADGTVSYTPEANFFGEDLFTYRLNDGVIDIPALTPWLVAGPQHGWR